MDVCPNPRPQGYNALTEDWAERNHCNPPFSKRRNPERIGPTDFCHKAIAENRLGKTVVLTLPVRNFVDLLLRAGAEMRPLGRVKWRHPKTGETHPSSPFIAAFILHGHRRGVVLSR
jgi:hypothetical protein